VQATDLLEEHLHLLEQLVPMNKQVKEVKEIKRVKEVKRIKEVKRVKEVKGLLLTWEVLSRSLNNSSLQSTS
jgi:hypothetical protein